MRRANYEPFNEQRDMPAWLCALTLFLLAFDWIAR